MEPLAVDAGAYDVWSGRFRDRVVVVTGAASGIGAATARRFWTEGARVVLADLNVDAMNRLAEKLNGDRCVTHVVDVADPDQVDALIDAAIETFGRLDVLINNAGIAVSGPLADATTADWNRVLAVNAGGVFNGCRAAVGHLIRTRGNIVNTASVSGLGGDWNLSMYNASKGAVVNLTRALALDLGRHGVRVNAVCPTVTLTGMSAGIEQDEEALTALRPRIPLGRIGRPADIAAAITFLASDDARFITGVNLPVDGGVTASNGQPDLH